MHYEMLSFMMIDAMINVTCNFLIFKDSQQFILNLFCFKANISNDTSKTIPSFKPKLIPISAIENKLANVNIVCNDNDLNQLQSQEVCHLFFFVLYLLSFTYFI